MGPLSTATPWDSTATAQPTQVVVASPIASATASSITPTPIIERVVEPPYPCILIRLDATLSVGEQLEAAHDSTIDVICDPDSMVVPRTRLQ